MLGEIYTSNETQDITKIYGYMALENGKLQGFSVFSQEGCEADTCGILALDVSDMFIADGLLRKGLFSFYEKGITFYSFKTIPVVTLPNRYKIIEKGSLADLFAPCCTK